MCLNQYLEKLLGRETLYLFIHVICDYSASKSAA